MTQESEYGQRLSSIDKFSVLSSIIGVMADSITIFSIFYYGISTQSIPFILWLFAFVSIAITVTLVGFFSRKIFVARVKKVSSKLTNECIDRIESGATSLTMTVGLMLFIPYSIVLVRANTSNNPESIMVFILVFGILIGGTISWFVSHMLNDASALIYKAFDIHY